MDHVLSELGLQLTYLRGRAAIKTLDQEGIFNELLDGTPVGEPPAWAGRRFLSDYDHVLLASDLASGNTLGLIGAHDRRADRASFLWLETGFVVGHARGRNLMRRMIALLLLRVVSFGAVPDCVATVTGNGIGVHVLRQMAQRLGAASFAPAAEGPVVDLGRVRLMRRVSNALGVSATLGGAIRTASTRPGMPQGLPRPATHALPDMPGEPMLALLDLRTASEAQLIADLRRMYRARTSRTVTRTATVRAASR